MKPYDQKKSQEKKLLNVVLHDNILATIAKVQATEAKIKKWDYIKLKTIL